MVDAGVCLFGLRKLMNGFTRLWAQQTRASSPGGVLHSRQFDAFGHCWISCEGSRKCGETPTFVAGTAHELYRELERMGGRAEHDSFTPDLANQKLGRTVSHSPGTCFDLCDQAHSAGRMDLSAPVHCVDETLTKRIPCPP